MSAVVPTAAPVPPLGITAPLTDAEFAAWLAQPERSGVRTDVQFAWNIRAILTEWAARPPAASVPPDLLQRAFDRVTGRTRWRRNCHAADAGYAVRDRTVLAFLRAAPLTIPATVYGPPVDPWVIKTCFETVLRLSNAITDPVERAFFLLTHLLYLCRSTSATRRWRC